MLMQHDEPETSEGLLPVRGLQPVHRALHSRPPRLEDVGVDHRRLDSPVAEDLLHRPDVVANIGPPASSRET